MRGIQASFSSGELSPLLHARVDLARYQTGLAELKNFIVLPQGGVMRRPNFSLFENGTSADARLIPFEYNIEDNVILEFRDRQLRVIKGTDGYIGQVVASGISTPYTNSELKDLRYVQSGNVMFFAHKNHTPRMLTRNSMTSWKLEELPFHGGPFVDSVNWGSDVSLTISAGGDTRTVTGNGVFSSSLVGTLLKLEYPLPAKTGTVESIASPSYGASEWCEVKGTFNVTTSGDWVGTVWVERSIDGGTNWATVRSYTRSDIQTQGQWDFTISETEECVLYRVCGRHYTDEMINNSTATSGILAVLREKKNDDTKKTSALITYSASGFLKSEIYKITSVASASQATIQRQSELDVTLNNNFSGKVTLWAMGAWGTMQGYPSTVTMYQDRLIFAASNMFPQTMWFSRISDYANFSVSDPLKDDDAITITLVGSSSDRIHSLLTATDLLVFTNSGEWLIKGAGDAGAITPTALSVHQQTNIGTKNIQPILANGRIILVQTQGQKVFALGYDLSTDGYAGSELSILSSHILEDNPIVDMAYQKTPYSLLWFVLQDGTFATCTYTPEHEVVGWAKHDSFYKLKSCMSLQSKKQTEVFIVVTDTSNTPFICKFVAKPDVVNCIDYGKSFESSLRTLRLTFSSESGSMFAAKKLISRLTVTVLDSTSAWIAPGGVLDATNWERRRKLTFTNSKYLSDEEIQLDNGFDKDACIQIKTADDKPLTILAITPHITEGG